MKESLHLDYRCAPSYTRWGRGLLGLGVLSIVAAALGYHQLSSLETKLQAVQNVSQASISVTPLRPDRQRQDEIQQASEIGRRLALPWETLFQSLEASGDANVAVLDIESQASPSTVKITAEARDFAAMTHYVERLQALDFFARVVLLTHHLRSEDPQHPVRFTVSAFWGTPS